MYQVPEESYVGPEKTKRRCPEPSKSDLRTRWGATDKSSSVVACGVARGSGSSTRMHCPLKSELLWHSVACLPSSNYHPIAVFLAMTLAALTVWSGLYSSSVVENLGSCSGLVWVSRSMCCASSAMHAL